MKKFHVNLIFFALSFYGFGAGIMDSFVIYDGWNYVGANEFPELHQAMGQKIISFYVFPLMVLTVFTIILYWSRPASIPRGWITMALIAQMAVWLSSIFIQIPIQFQLDQGKDQALLDKLITTDWIRIIGWLAYMVIVVAMLYRINSAYLPVIKRKMSV